MCITSTTWKKYMRRKLWMGIKQNLWSIQLCKHYTKLIQSHDFWLLSDYELISKWIDLKWSILLYHKHSFSAEIWLTANYKTYLKCKAINFKHSPDTFQRIEIIDRNTYIFHIYTNFNLWNTSIFNIYLSIIYLSMHQFWAAGLGSHHIVWKHSTMESMKC